MLAVNESFKDHFNVEIKRRHSKTSKHTQKKTIKILKSICYFCMFHAFLSRQVAHFLKHIRLIFYFSFFTRNGYIRRLTITKLTGFTVQENLR